MERYYNLKLIAFYFKGENSTDMRYKVFLVYNKNNKRHLVCGKSIPMVFKLKKIHNNILII